MPTEDKPQRLYYDAKLKERARDLRKKGTLSEVLLWQKLRARQVMGYKFSRQKAIGGYIVDFYCHELKLIIEIDGTSHENKWDKDMERQKYLENLGLEVLRFEDIKVKQDMDNVLFALEGWIRNNGFGP